MQSKTVDRPKVDLNTEIASIIVQFHDQLEVDRVDVVYRDSSFSEDKFNTAQVIMFEPSKIPGFEVNIKQLCFEIAGEVYSCLINKDEFSAIEIRIVDEENFLGMHSSGDSYKFTYTEIEKNSID